MNNPLVSIYCITYNHAPFIRQCLDGFVMQKTDFPVEALIHDDASTDGTADIIREYEQKYPDLIKPIYQTENQWSKGVNISMFNFSRVRGKYLAICEGDDYWTDPRKLQKQVDFFASHPDCSICCHPVAIIDEDNPEFNEVFPQPKDGACKTIFTLDDLLLSRFFIKTLSVMYRWRNDAMSVLPTDIVNGDTYLHMLHAQKGNIGFIDEVMGVYRRHQGGIWSSLKTPNDQALKYGIQIVALYDHICKNIAPQPEQYRANIFMGNFHRVMSVFARNGRVAEIELLLKKYPNDVMKLRHYCIV